MIIMLAKPGADYKFFLKMGAIRQFNSILIAKSHNASYFKNSPYGSEQISYTIEHISVTALILKIMNLLNL